MGEEKCPTDLFLNEKPVKLLVRLRDPETENYASALAFNNDVTYTHTVKCLKRMNKHGLVEFEKKGRRKQVELTDKGDQIARDFYEVLKRLTDQ